MLAAKIKSVSSADGKNASSKSKSAFIVNESESSLSCDDFIDSSSTGEDGNGELLISFSQEATIICDQPTLESLLDNLSLDNPIINPFNQNQVAISGKMKASRENSISWLSSAFRWEPTTNSNYIIDVSSTEQKPIILYASKIKLIEKLTTILDYKFMEDFLLTLEMIIHPTEFASILLSRLAQAFRAAPGWSSEEKIDPEVVKMRGLIVLQHWAALNSTSVESNDAADGVSLDFSVRKIVLEGLDFIWKQSPTLSAGDKNYLIRIRRLYDPNCEISWTTFRDHLGGGDDDDDLLLEDEDAASSNYGSEALFSEEKGTRKWASMLKSRFKSIFSSKSSSISRSFTSSPLGSPQSSSSLLVNSFSSDWESNDDGMSAFLMKERSKTIAAILAVLEGDLLRMIKRSELVVFPVIRNSPQRLAEECPNLQRAIDHFNSMCQWFVHIISNAEEDGPSLLAKLIRLAVKCILIHNCNTALQIILALQAPAVTARKDLWRSLPSWERQLANDLAIFGSPSRNFKNVRRALDEIYREEIAVVPFNGLFLSDLVFNYERSSGPPSDSEMVLSRNGALIPFYKNHVAAKIVRYFTEFQHPRHRFLRALNDRERQLYSYFADIGRLGGEFQLM